MINFSSKLRFSSIKLIQHILRANNKIILNKDAELKKNSIISVRKYQQHKHY